MDLTKKIVMVLQEAHGSGISQIEEVATELRAEIETCPQMLGSYCYSGTPIPVAYVKGVINYFSNKD